MVLDLLLVLLLTTMPQTVKGLASLGSGWINKHKASGNHGKVTIFCSRFPLLCHDVRVALRKDSIKQQSQEVTHALVNAFHPPTPGKNYLPDKTHSAKEHFRNGMNEKVYKRHDKMKFRALLLSKARQILNDDIALSHSVDKNSDRQKILILLLKILRQKDFTKPEKLAEDLLKYFEFS